jgi:pimeloyl-ACP methyl ester carboxylesterase
MKTPKIYKSEAGRRAILSVYDSFLARWPIPYEGLSIPPGLGKTFVIACGDPSAPPLLLMHGSSANASFWMGDIACYARHYRVYALDIPGEPGKSEASRPSLQGPAYEDWLCSVINWLHIDKTAIIGISLGACIATRFAITDPERVLKLVLECPSGIAPQKSEYLFKAAFLLLLGNWGKEKILKEITAGTPIPEEVGRYIILIAEHFSPRMELIPIFQDEDLKRLTMPVLLLAGGKDVFLPSQRTAERLTRLLPNLQVNLMPDAGHVLVNLASPILEFLRNP